MFGWSKNLEWGKLYSKKKSIESADKVITVSQYLKNLSDRIDSIVIYNGIDCDLFNSNTKPSLIKTKKYTHGPSC